MVRKLMLSLCLSLVNLFVFAQDFKVSGTVIDLKTAKPVVGAVVYELYTSDNGTSTDTEGFFSLSFKNAKVRIKVAYIGYKDTVLNLSLVQDIDLLIYLKSLTDIDEVEIEDDEILWTPDLDSIKGNPKPIEANLIEPVIQIHEEEIINPITINMDPGSLNDLYYTRGKGTRQELIYIDGSRVFNSYNLFDFIPFVQDEALGNFNRFETYFPSRYGDVLTSVTDISTKEGNFKSYEGSVYFDLFNLGLSAEGPILKDKSSLFIAGRLSWLNNPYTKLFMAELNASNENWANPAFYDINLKYTHKLTKSDKLSVSVFKNTDFLTSEIYESSKIDLTGFNNRNIRAGYSNSLASLKLDHSFSPKFAGNFSLNFSQYTLKNDISGDSVALLNGSSSVINTYNAYYRTGNNDFSFKMNFMYNFNLDHTLRFGSQITNHHFNTITAELNLNDYEQAFTIDTSWSDPSINSVEYILFVDDQITISDNLLINGGLHFSAFTNSDKTYYSVQPRLFAEYKMFEGLKIRAAFAHYKQYIHLLANNSIGLSADIFLPSGQEIKPQLTNHFSAGVSLNLPFDIQIRADAFYDRMSNVLDYKFGFSWFDSPGSNHLTGTEMSDRISQGRGDLYGIRILFNKDIDNLKFKIGHSMSKYDRNFVEMNNDESFQYKYNRRHDFDFGLNYIINDNFTLQVDFVYRSGNNVTIDKQSYIPYDKNEQTMGTSDQNVNTYLWSGEALSASSNINDYQLPAYHRLDISANYLLDNHTFGIKIYNLYNRRNADYIDYRNSELSNSSDQFLVKYSFLPFLPTICYSYRIKY